MHNFDLYIQYLHDMLLCYTVQLAAVLVGRAEGSQRASGR